MYEIIIYSDGSCYPNPGQGGYGAVIIKEDDIMKINGYEYYTTSIRMEMMGALKAIELLRTKSRIKVFSDCKYVVNGINHYLRNFRYNENKKNIDLWLRFYKQRLYHKKLKAEWVKGHNGNHFNNIADILANKGRLLNTSKINLNA